VEKIFELSTKDFRR